MTRDKLIRQTEATRVCAHCRAEELIPCRNCGDPIRRLGIGMWIHDGGEERCWASVETFAGPTDSDL